MNQNATIGLIAAVLVLGGGVWYLANHGSTPATPYQGAAVAQTGSTASGSGTIASLMARTGDYECTVTVANAQTPTTGTVDLSGGKMAGKFSTTVNGTTVNAYMVNDGAYIYSWSDLAPQGVKVAVTPVAPGAPGAQPAQAGFDPNTNVDYSCAPWTANAAAFVPPTTVTFMTYGGPKQ